MYANHDVGRVGASCADANNFNFLFLISRVVANVDLSDATCKGTLIPLDIFQL